MAEDRLVEPLPLGSADRLSRDEICERASRMPAVTEWGSGWRIGCEFEPTDIDGLSLIHIRSPGREELVLLEGRRGAERLVASLQVCWGGPDGNAACGNVLLRIHESSARRQTVLALETESDSYDYDPGVLGGEEAWDRQLTVCAYRDSLADLACTVTIPLEHRREVFDIRGGEEWSGPFWDRIYSRTLVVSAIAVVRADGRVRLRAQDGTLDQLLAAFGGPPVDGDDVTYAWDPATGDPMLELGQRVEPGRRAVFRMDDWPSRPDVLGPAAPPEYPDYVDPERVEALRADEP